MWQTSDPVIAEQQIKEEPACRSQLAMGEQTLRHEQVARGARHGDLDRAALDRQAPDRNRPAGRRRCPRPRRYKAGWPLDVRVTQKNLDALSLFLTSSLLKNGAAGPVHDLSSGRGRRRHATASKVSWPRPGSWTRPSIGLTNGLIKRPGSGRKECLDPCRSEISTARRS
jgi:hypothetical protein